MACHPSVYTTLSIAQGGWCFEKESKYFRYAIQKNHIDAASKVLAGFYDARLHLYAPSLRYVINQDNAVLLCNLSHNLFFREKHTRAN